MASRSGFSAVRSYAAPPVATTAAYTSTPQVKAVVNPHFGYVLNDQGGYVIGTWPEPPLSEDEA